MQCCIWSIKMLLTKPFAKHNVPLWSVMALCKRNDDVQFERKFKAHSCQVVFLPPSGFNHKNIPLCFLLLLLQQQLCFCYFLLAIKKTQAYFKHLWGKQLYNCLSVAMNTYITYIVVVFSFPFTPPL